MATKPWTDPIVGEVRQWRAEVLRQADNDLDKLCDMLVERQRQHAGRVENREIITLEELNARIDRREKGGT